MQNWKNHIFGLKDVVIFSLASLLLGFLAGFLLSPVKKGMTIGCNYISKDDDLRDDLELEMSELCR